MISGTFLILLPPCRVRSQVCRWSQSSHLPPYSLSFSAPPNQQPFFPSGFHKRSLKIGATGKEVYVKKGTLPARSKGLCHSTSFQPLSRREQTPELLYQPGPAVTPLPAGHRTDEQLSRENRMGKSINTYTCWKWRSSNTWGSLLQGASFSVDHT